MSRFILSILLVADLFHPISNCSIEPLLNCDVGHSGCACSAMPVLFAWLKPNDVSRSNLLDGAARPLEPAPASCDDQSLTKGMCMPCRTSAGFERDTCSRYAGGIRALKQRIDPYSAREPLRHSAGPFAEGWLPTLLISIYVSPFWIS